MSTQAPTASQIEINSARLSFIWAEILPDLLTKGTPSDSPFAFLTRGYMFQGKFKAALAPQSPRDFQAPWVPERKQQFWMRYLVQGKLNEAGPSKVWQSLVPLRTPVEARLQADWFQGTAYLDAFYYPFGLGLAVTFRWEPNLPLADLLPKAYEFRKNGKFSLKRGDTQNLSLERVADAVLTSLRKRALGEGSAAGIRTPEPFSIMTIIQATGVQPDADVREEKNIMHFLEVATNWPGDYKYLQLPDPATVCLRTKRSAPLGSALYAQERGRTIWFPGLFRAETDGTTLAVAEQSRRSSKLACYHRNLLFGSLQTEALGRLISYTAKLFAAGKTPNDLTVHHRTVVEYAARQLAKMFLGDKSNTWRSDSLARQIKENGFQDLQAVLSAFGQTPLP